MKITIEIPNNSPAQTGNTDNQAQTISVTEADGGGAVITETDATTESKSASIDTDTNSFDGGSPPEWLLAELQRSDGGTETLTSTQEEAIDAGSPAF